MMDTARDRARIEIVFGFSVTALGSLIGLIYWISEGGIRYSSNADVQSFASTFAFLAGAVVWWFLSEILTNDVTPRMLARKALLGLMLEELFIALASLAYVVEFRDLAFSWSLAGNTLVGLGALLSATGFYSMLRTYRDAQLAQPVDN